jgi:hypothetical protein
MHVAGVEYALGVLPDDDAPATRGWIWPRPLRFESTRSPGFHPVVHGSLLGGEMRCRVCGLRHDEAIWGVDGQSATFDICACCVCEHGYEDCSPDIDTGEVSGGSYPLELPQPS